MSQIKHLVNRRIQKIIETNPEQAESQSKDQTKINLLIMTSLFLKASQFVMYLICISYSVGMFWLEASSMKSNLPSEDTDFNQEYELESKSPSDITISMIYFMFTSLSTVGLGDFHPKNSIERVFGIVLLFFGVLITSYIMGNFSKMITQI